MARRTIVIQCLAQKKTKLFDNFFSNEAVIRVIAQEEVMKKSGLMYTPAAFKEAFPGKTWKVQDECKRRDMRGHLIVLIKVYDQADGVFAFEEISRDTTLHQKTIDDGSLSVTEDQQLQIYSATVARTHADALSFNHRKRALTKSDLSDEEQQKKKAKLIKEQGEKGVKQEPGTRRSLAEALDQSPLAAISEGALANPKKKAAAKPKASAEATSALRGKEALIDLTEKALGAVAVVAKAFCAAQSADAFDEASIAPASGLLKGKEDKLVKADLYDKVTEVRGALAFCKAMTLAVVSGQEILCIVCARAIGKQMFTLVDVLIVCFLVS